MGTVIGWGFAAEGWMDARYKGRSDQGNVTGVASASRVPGSGRVPPVLARPEPPQSTQRVETRVALVHGAHVYHSTKLGF